MALPPHLTRTARPLRADQPRRIAHRDPARRPTAPHLSAGPGGRPPDPRVALPPHLTRTARPLPAGPPDRRIATAIRTPPAGAGYSVRWNSAMAIPSMARPITATIPSDNPTGTDQPPHVTPGASVCRAAGLMLKWLNTASRMGATL